ncbi:MAG: hypothetical protein IH594_18070 [Bacteroidales bacterium]|nr:hypothetical protein [Bacteroidales bacterium]
MRTIIILLWGFLLVPSAFYAQEKQAELTAILQERGEVFVAMKISSLKSFHSPSILTGFDRVRNDSVYLYLTLKDSLFITQNLGKLEILTPPSMIQAVAMSSDRNTVLQGKAYPTYPLYLEIMEFFRDSFPDLCTIDTLGYTVRGRLMLAARIGEHRDSPGKVPVTFFSSTMHGDEPVGYVFMLQLIHHILTGNDALVPELLKKITIIIHPLENPDGCYFSSNETIYGATRGNANGVNLNRNYPDPQDGDHPDGNDWQPETMNMMNYLEKYPPSLSANFHSGAEVVNYPFDTWSLAHADQDWFRFISSEYAGLASSLLPGYMDGFSGGITNGYDWYEVSGGRQDYVTWFLRGRETTIELSDSKFLPEEELLSYWQANREPMLNYLKQGMFGIHGTVFDSLTSEKLKAEITVLEYDKLNSSVFSDSIHGSFFRYLKEGNYRLKINASGYREKITGEIRVNDYETTDVTYYLIPDIIPPEINTFKTGPNPFTSELTLFLEINEPGTVFYRIYDVYGQVRLDGFGIFPAGYHEYTLQPVLSSGCYFLELVFGEEKKFFRLVKLNSDM